MNSKFKSHNSDEKIMLKRLFLLNLTNRFCVKNCTTFWPVKLLTFLSENLPKHISIYSSLVNYNFALCYSDNFVQGIIARLTYGINLDFVY